MRTFFSAILVGVGNVILEGDILDPPTYENLLFIILIIK